MHIDPVSIFCAVIKKVRTYSGSLTLVNQGLLLPDQLMQQHEAKQLSALKRQRQMIAQTAHLDQEERECHMNYMRAIASAAKKHPMPPNQPLQELRRGRKLEKRSRCRRSSQRAPERHLRARVVQAPFFFKGQSKTSGSTSLQDVNPNSCMVYSWSRHVLRQASGSMHNSGIHASLSTSMRNRIAPV